MIIGNPVIMGGGGGILKWNIATGEIAPPVLTNGLWVETATPLEDFTIIFDSSQPATPANNTLFFRYYPGYPAAEPIQDQTGIIYDVIACRIYTTAGGWQNVNAYREENGEWVLFSTADWHFYALSSANVLSKYTQQGQIVWSHTFSYAPVSWCLDWVNRVVYVMLKVTKDTFNIAVINADTGDGDTLWPSDGTYALTGLQYRVNLKLSPDRKTLWASTNFPYTSISYSYLTISIDTATQTFMHYSTPLQYLDITADGVVAGLRQNSSKSFKVRTLYPTDAESAQVNSSANMGVFLAPYGKYIWRVVNGSEDDYYYGDVSSLSRNQATLTNVWWWNGGLFLPNTDFAALTNTGINFYTVAENGALSSYPYKSLPLPSMANFAKVFPDGKILALSSVSNAVYLIDTDDTVSTIGSVATNYLEVEPGNYPTFPELSRIQ